MFVGVVVVVDVFFSVHSHSFWLLLFLCYTWLTRSLEREEDTNTRTHCVQAFRLLCPEQEWLYIFREGIVFVRKIKHLTRHCHARVFEFVSLRSNTFAGVRRLIFCRLRRSNSDQKHLNLQRGMRDMNGGVLRMRNTTDRRVFDLRSAGDCRRLNYTTWYAKFIQLWTIPVGMRTGSQVPKSKKKSIV